MSFKIDLKLVRDILTSITPNIEWAIVSKQAFRKKLEKKVKIKFLHPNFINYYNLDMN